MSKSRRAADRRRERAQGDPASDDDVDDRDDQERADGEPRERTEPRARRDKPPITEDAEAAFARELQRPNAGSGDEKLEQTSVLPKVSDQVTSRGGHLVVLDGPDAGQKLALSVTPTLIGRLRTAEIVLSDPTISRRHLELVWSGRDDRFRLVDLGSTSGTVVNGEVVESDVVLAHGDVIALGKTELRFLRAEDAPGPRPEPEPSSEPSLEAEGFDPVAPRERTKTRSVTMQRAAPPMMTPGERRAAAKGCVSFVLVVLVIAASGYGLYQWLWSQTSPSQIRTQVTSLLEEARLRLAAGDIDRAKSLAETLIALEPRHEEGQSILRMATTEAASRDALALALRFADEENDPEALAVLTRIPDTSVLAEARDRLRKSLLERQRSRSRRKCEDLVAQGRNTEALAAIGEHRERWPDDEQIAALEQRAHQAKPRAPTGVGTAARARAAFANGDVDGARQIAEDGGARAYVADLDRFAEAVREGRGAMQSKEGARALPYLDEAFRLLLALGGRVTSPMFADLQRPYSNALYLAATDDLDSGRGCDGARHLMRAVRVAPDDPKIIAKVRELDEHAEAGLTKARSVRPADPVRAHAIAEAALCFARTGSATYSELRALAK